MRDENVVRKILEEIDPQSADTIIEIGPGEGVLTKHLAASRAKIIAIELDNRMYDQLRSRPEFSDVTFLHQDVLKTDFSTIDPAPGKKFRIVGNIPYNITSPILFHLLDHRTQIADATIMMQKEVAERIVAAPGSKRYGILAVTFQLLADVRSLFNVSPKSFWPIPKVDSTILSFTFLRQPRFAVLDESFTRTMVRTAFGKRRKMMRNSLLDLVDSPSMLEGMPYLDKRPEALSIQQLVDLSNLLYARVPHA